MRLAFRSSFAATTAFLFLILVSGVQSVSAQTAAAGEIIISEFRVRGPSGANDEFIEIYNKTAEHTVTALSGTGYSVVASDGTVRCTIPNGTVIPLGGHYLCVNSVAYSLSSYPAGNGTTATGDATYTTDIPDNVGIAIFNTSVPADFTLANRLDAVGSSSEANTLYKEGTGYPALTPFSIDYSFYRKIVGTCTNAPNNCGLVSGSFPIDGNISTIQDTDDNTTDFVFVDINGTSAGAGQRLGAPGPENLSSPTIFDQYFPVSLLDATVSKSSSPNRVRDFTSDPAQNSTFGTIAFRRRFTNETGVDVSRLRFRVVDQTTFPAVSGVADLRTRTSSTAVVAGINDALTCAAKVPAEAAPCSVTVEATTVETPPSQPNGGAYNSSYSAGTIALQTPLLAGQSIVVQFLLGIQQTGNFRFYVAVEALVAPSLPPAQRTNDGGRKKARWASRAGLATGIIDATPVTSLKPGAAPGWFVVVPATRGWATPSRGLTSSRERHSAENSKKPAIRKSRDTAATLELAVPLVNSQTFETPSRPATVSLIPAGAPRAAAVSSTPAAPAAAIAASAVKAVSSPKERPQSRRADGRTRRKALRKR